MFIVALIVTASATNSIPQELKVTETVLPNGLKVLLRKNISRRW
jgi:hypothetical protein